MDFTLEMEKIAAEFEQEHGALPKVTRLEELNRGYQLWLSVGGQELSEARYFSDYLRWQGYTPCRMALDDTLAFFRMPPNPTTSPVPQVPKLTLVPRA